MPCQCSPIELACQLENLSLLQMFLSALPDPPEPGDALIRIVRLLISLFMDVV